MLEIKLPSKELFDEEKQVFITSKEKTIQLEHSLISISKWESKWNKPFLGKNEKTEEESLDYIRCMMISHNFDMKKDIYPALTTDIIKTIQNYIGSAMTATTINERGPKKQNKEVITSEIIYYWMIAHNIPFECQKWHLNRLLTLISVCNIKNAPKDKMSKKDLASRNRSLNAARKRQYNTKG